MKSPAAASLRLESLLDNLNACSGCGLCLAVCPTFALAQDETEAPRGRIRLMREVVDGALAPGAARGSVDSCLRCGSCHDACPTGVDVGIAVTRYLDEVDRRRAAGSGARLATLRARAAFLVRKVGLLMQRVARKTGRPR